ncbi:Protein kinase domain-containing protein [Fusarium sp. LHS14.1]|nr:Protein kinase domain-containing protein [Fusarium sp. LHS14.1]
MAATSYDHIRTRIENEMMDLHNDDEEFKGWIPLSWCVDLLNTEEDVRAALDASETKWKGCTSRLAKFVRDRAPCLFVMLVYSSMIELLEQFHEKDIGDACFPLEVTFQRTNRSIEGVADRQVKLRFPRGTKPKDAMSLFSDDQWLFFAPKLCWTAFDDPPLTSKHKLPFITSLEKFSGTEFSIVYKISIHRDYVDMELGDLEIASDAEGHPYVAVKKLLPNSLTKDAFTSVVKAEHETLTMLRKLPAKHLIKATAFYKRDDDLFFLFPWAQHGNLRNQLHGLADAIRTLHHAEDSRMYRHGDLKPENILYFNSSANPKTLKDHTCCVLVISDISLSRTHDKSTQFHSKTKMVGGETIAYAAPETELYPDRATSRRYDIWSLGCLYLEFVIWLLYGIEELDRFGREIHGKFYTIIDRPETLQVSKMEQAKVNPEVDRWIENIKKDPRCTTAGGSKQTAVSLVVDLIKERLLVTAANPDPRDPDPKGTQTVSDSGGRSYDSGFHLIIRAPTKIGEGFLDSRVPDAGKDERAYVLEVCDKLDTIIQDAQNVATTKPAGPHNSLNDDVQLGFPELPDAGSPTHIEVLREWIRDCDTHQCLHSQDEPFLPTRLLDVEEHGMKRSRLICDTTTLPKNAKYLALSHRWGSHPKPGVPDPLKGKIVCTYAKNINTLKQGIDAADLPSTYQDGITVARELGVQFIWIDSLCIIQQDKSDRLDKDKGDDWKREAEQMERVFRSAYASIAASCASSPAEPFLKSRPERQCVKMQTGNTPYYLCDTIDDFSEDVEQGELNKRGWVLQERALSRRTIYFTEKQTYWECGEGVRCETLTKTKNSKTTFLGDANFPNSFPDYVKGKKIKLYQDLYERYSKLALSYPTDRPIAIRGLERRLRNFLGTRAGYGVFDVYLRRGLLWQREQASLQRIDFSNGNESVPSWSWMTYAGSIRYMNVPLGGVEWGQWENDVVSPWKDYNGVQDGGKAPNSALKVLVRDILVSVIEPSARVFLDEPSRTFGRPFKCVIVGSSKSSQGQVDIRTTYYALVVTPLSGQEDRNVYERAGVAFFHGYQIVWDNPGVEGYIY